MIANGIDTGYIITFNRLQNGRKLKGVHYYCEAKGMGTEFDGFAILDDLMDAVVFERLHSCYEVYVELWEAGFGVEVWVIERLYSSP